MLNIFDKINALKIYWDWSNSIVSRVLAMHMDYQVQDLASNMFPLLMPGLTFESRAMSHPKLVAAKKKSCIRKFVFFILIVFIYFFSYCFCGTSCLMTKLTLEIFKACIWKNNFAIILISSSIIIKTILIQSSAHNTAFRKTGKHFENNVFCLSSTFICHLHTVFFFPSREIFALFSLCCQGWLYCHPSTNSRRFLLPNRIRYWPSSFR